MKDSTKKLLITVGVLAAFVVFCLILNLRGVKNFHEKYDGVDLSVDAEGAVRKGTYAGYLRQHAGASTPSGETDVSLFNYTSEGEVEVTDKLPETKPAKKKATMMQRPDSMKSEDTDKDEVLQTLWDLMDKAHIIDPLLIQSVVAEKEYYDVKTPIRDYDKEFIEDVLIEAWDQVNAMAQDKMEELPF